MNLKLEQIRIDGGTQARTSINEEAVANYAEFMTDGGQLPAIAVAFDGADYWLADGFHRWHAHKRIGALSIEVEIHQGTLRDAVLMATGANRAHGLPRTNADKRKAVEMTLATAPDWSDRKVAMHVGVSITLVGAIRRPEVAAKQAAASKAKRERPQSEKGCSGTTPPQDSRVLPADPPAAAPAELPTIVVDPDDAQQLRHLVQLLESENQVLTDRLAVECMEASEEDKLLAAETIKELRAEITTLSAQVRAIAATRDSLMEENAQLKRQCMAQQRQLKKVAA